MVWAGHTVWCGWGTPCGVGGAHTNRNTANIPSIVYVLPVPVCPYAKTVPTGGKQKDSIFLHQLNRSLYSRTISQLH